MNYFLASPEVLKLSPVREPGQETRRTSCLILTLKYHLQEQDKKKQQVSRKGKLLEVFWG